MKQPLLYLLFWLCLFLFLAESVNAQSNKNLVPYTFVRKEFNSGVLFHYGNEREELRTDSARFFDRQTRLQGTYRWESSNMVFLQNRQESWGFSIEAGPFAGKGSFIDSTNVSEIDASQKFYGIRGNAGANYNSRYYFDEKTYTLVSVNAWGRYGVYGRHAEGTIIDSNLVVHPYSNKKMLSRLRYGLNARSGWGTGRLNPMNNYMTAVYILKEFFPERLFSEEEIRAVAYEAGRIKQNRNVRKNHSVLEETEQLIDFVRQQFLLKLPDEVVSVWELSEFRPRFDGSRFELGPFFNYFNREPDFVYGGYIKFENSRFSNLNRNRNFSAVFSYNSYKRRDWVLAELNLGWSFYPTLNSEYGFGMKYFPAMVVNGLPEKDRVHHNFVPYVEYFSQMNSKYRIVSSLVWYFSPTGRFVVPGPEVTVSLYKSRY